MPQKKRKLMIAERKYSYHLIAIVSGLLFSLTAEAANPNDENFFINTRKCDNCDLSNSQFSNRLETAFLERAFINNSNLNGANFSGVQFTNSSITNSVLIEANFSEAQFFGFSLSNNNLRGADFSQIRMDEGSLAAGDYTNAKFNNSIFMGIAFGTLENPILNPTSAEQLPLIFKDADFSGSTFTRSSMVLRAEETRAYFERVGYPSYTTGRGGPGGIESIGADNLDFLNDIFSFSSTKAEESLSTLALSNPLNSSSQIMDFTGANFGDFTGTSLALPFANFSNADLQNSTFEDTIFIASDFQNANLKGASFIDVNLVEAKITQDQINSLAFFSGALPDGTIIQSVTTPEPTTISSLVFIITVGVTKSVVQKRSK